jgi:hypothetical protein
VRSRIIDLTLEAPELSPRKLAVRFTDTQGYLVSEASVYRLLKAHALIASPAFILVEPADEFHGKSTASNQLWQTDFNHLKVTGLGWFSLSTVLDDFSWYIIVWKLCTTTAAADVTETLEAALAASGCEQTKARHRVTDALRQRSLLRRSRPCQMARREAHRARPRSTLPSPDPGQDRALAPDTQDRILPENYYLPGDLEAQIQALPSVPGSAAIPKSIWSNWNRSRGTQLCWPCKEWGPGCPASSPYEFQDMTQIVPRAVPIGRTRR